MAAFLLTVLATPFSCLPQAVGLAVYASHEEQVDVMLAAIADGRRERVAVSAAWAKGPVGQRLEEYEPPPARQQPPPPMQYQQQQ